MESEPPSPLGEIAETDMGWDDDAGPWTYRILPEPFLSTELARLSGAQSLGTVDLVSFQPCPDPNQRSQDRYAVHEWELPGGTWTFTGVFDGHAGHETVDHTVEVLPSQIKAKLAAALKKADKHTLSSESVSNILSNAIAAFDDSITVALLDLFPGGPDAISKLSDDEIQAIVNDGGNNSAIVLRCMRGSTVLVSLTDPAHANLWVASLGDCSAVLGTKCSDGWQTAILSSNHNAIDEGEVQRIRSEHPGEAECIVRDRVLGALAVTRAVGDHLFKLPQIYTTRIFTQTNPGFQISTPLDDFLSRNRTPPYVLNKADVMHAHLGPSSSASVLSSDPKLISAATTTSGPEPVKGSKHVLVLCSDGLTDLYDVHARLPQHLAETWVRIVGDKGVAEDRGERKNLALSLLRDAIGGDDAERVSRTMTVEMTERWMDDTTILVQRL